MPDGVLYAAGRTSVDSIIFVAIHKGICTYLTHTHFSIMAFPTTQIRDEFVFKATAETIACLLERLVPLRPVPTPAPVPNPNVNVVGLFYTLQADGHYLVKLVTGPDDPTDAAGVAFATQRTIEELQFLGIRYKIRTVVQERDPRVGTAGGGVSNVPGVIRAYQSALICRVGVTAFYFGETDAAFGAGQVSFFFEVPREQAAQALAIVASIRTDTPVAPCITRDQCVACSARSNCDEHRPKRPHCRR